jgi:hypothetical protein
MIQHEHDLTRKPRSPEQGLIDSRLLSLTRSWSLAKMARGAMRTQHGQRSELMAVVSRHTNLFGRFGQVETTVQTDRTNDDIVRIMAHGDMLGGLQASVTAPEQEMYIDALTQATEQSALTELRARINHQALPAAQLQDFTNEQFAQAA